MKRIACLLIVIYVVCSGCSAKSVKQDKTVTQEIIQSLEAQSFEELVAAHFRDNFSSRDRVVDLIDKYLPGIWERVKNPKILFPADLNENRIYTDAYYTGGASEIAELIERKKSIKKNVIVVFLKPDYECWTLGGTIFIFPAGQDYPLARHFEIIGYEE